MSVPNARPYNASLAKMLGIGKIILASVVTLIDLIRMVGGDAPSFGIAAIVPWFVSGGFGVAAAMTQTSCMLVATMVRKIDLGSKLS